jgi:regulation of enolase protein 1 (concanavalin A-like superfamily)
MLRESLDAGSKQAAMTLTGSNGVQMPYRLFTDGGSSEVYWLREQGGSEVAPIQLRLRRVGNEMFGAFWAPIIPGMPWVGFTWWEDSIVIPDLSADAYMGLAVCSGNTGALNTAQFAQVDWPDAPYYRAWKLSPDDGLTRLPTDPITLSWNAGDDATSHDVYFGTTNPPPFVQNQTATTYDTGALALNTMYYWQINEVGPGGTAVGEIRSFRTARVMAGTGEILGEIWWGIGGTTVPDLTGHSSYPYDVSDSLLLPLFEAPTDIGDNFGGRATGYLIPETSGDYTFWIASDDDSELYLSTDDKAWNMSLIASVTGWTQSREWGKYATQQSDPIYLEADQKYFVQALYKEGGGGDNMAVAWQGPDQPSRDVIDGYYLSPEYPYASDERPLGGLFAAKELKQLRWRAGSGADSHDVYFGTSNPPPFLVNQTDTVLPLGALIPDTDYYWRINEVSGSDVWVGQVLGFSTAEWIHLDIGPTLPGSSEYDEPTDTWTITANGYDIWDNDDKFRYVYTMPDLTRGDCTLTAHVSSIVGGTNDWRKAGVMIRESRSPGSKHAFMAAVPHNMSFQYRPETYNRSWDQTNYDQTAPGYVKLKRRGDVFHGYRSEDGVEWIRIGKTRFEMTEDVLVGMAVTSHNEGELTTATFEGFTIETPDPRMSWGPMPEDEAENQPIDTDLSWAPGEDVAYHIVYFGDNYDDVVAGTGNTYKGLRSTPDYDPGVLTLATTYYWVVDEMWHDGRDFGVEQGEVWSFTVSDIRLIDDFESYDVEPELPAQEEVVPGYTVVAEALPAQDVVDPGYTIPGYTIEAVAPDPACLIAEWAFEGNYDDTSGSGFHGTPVGDANIVADPCRGNVLSLDSDGDYVDCGNPAALNFSTGNWSLSVWTKNTMSGTGDANKGALIANGGDGGGGHRYCLILSEQDEGEVTLVTDDDSDKRQARGDATQVNDDVWHHVLGVRDGDTIRIYIDGVEEGSAGLPAGYDLSGTSQRPVLIGAIYHQGDGVTYKDYGGLIDDAQIYDCALTEGNARYLAGVGDKVVPPVVIPPTYGPLLVHYEFEDNANDSSGNLRDGVETAGRDGDMPTYEAGMIGDAIRFYDKGDHVLDDDSAAYMDGLDALTVSCWIKSDKTDRDEGWVHFSTSWNDQRSFRYDKDLDSSRTLQQGIKYGVATTGGNEQDESSDYVQTKNWQHVAMTWQSGTGIKLYIDGVLDENLGWDAAAVTGVLQGYSRLHVGKGSKDNSDNESWNGLVDDVRIYSAALSYGQIRTLAGQLADLEVPPVYGPLIGQYMFDADASDTSGNDNHGTLIGDALVEDGVLKLDGSGDCVNIGREDMYNLGQGPFSISLWANLSGWGGGWGNILVSKRGENGRGWQLRRRGGSQHLTFTTRGPGDDDPEGTITPSLNEWHHIVAVYDGSSKTVYIDGAVDRHTDGINNLTMAGHNVYIGARANRDNNGQEGHFNGMIDDVHFYKHALSCKERLSLSRLPAVNTPLSGTWAETSAEVTAKIIGPECDDPHAGIRSMRVDLNGSGELVRPAPFENFTEGEALAMVLFFKGDPDNLVDDMYISLRSSNPSGKKATLSIPDLADLKIPEWQAWNIELDAIEIDNDEGTEFPLPHVAKVALGFSGAGTIDIDDIVLMTSRCVPEFAQLGDFTDDCLVDKRDLKVMADDWLKIDEFGSGLIAHYEFEGNYDDSSGNGRHGTPVGAGITIDTDPTMGQVLSLPGGDDIYVNVGNVGLSGNAPRTIACWAKADHTSIPDWTLIFGFTTVGGGCGSHFNIGSIGGPGGVGAHAWCWEETIFSDTEALDWRHYAMTYDGTTIKYYGDGVPMDTDPGKSNVINLVHADHVQIGSRATQPSSFPGDVDDARIYRRLLSDDEIVEVMNGGDPLVYIPLISAANVSDDEPQGSKIVNFKDFNIMAEDWLTQQWWP